MNNKGFTFIEVLLTILISVTLIGTIMIIPRQILISYVGYSEEADYFLVNHRIRTALNRDLSSGHAIETASDGFRIGESRYTFTESDVYRYNAIDETTVRVSDVPLTYRFESGMLVVEHIDSDNRERADAPNVYLLFPLEQWINTTEGGSS